MSFAVKLILILLIFGAFVGYLSYSQRKQNRLVGQCNALVVRCPSCGNPATARARAWECPYCGDSGFVSDGYEEEEE
ncbi:MAG: hypothetical protein IJE09_03625 [Oscillospiraceae bacterium]|nr:hypothetical protein [Oscillospiraceae bacterium]